MSSDHIDAQESQGYVNNPQSAVNQQYGDENNINTGGGDSAGRNIDKSTTVNNYNYYVVGSSNQSIPSDLSKKLRVILDNADDPKSVLDKAINSAYPRALPVGSADYPPKTNDKIYEVEDRGGLQKFIELMAGDITLSSLTRKKLDDLMREHGLPTNGNRPEMVIAQRLKSYLIVSVRPEPNQKFCVNAWLIPDDRVKKISKRFCALDINKEQKGIMCSLEDISSVVKELLDLSLDSLNRNDGSYDLTIEFFLPVDHLSIEVDRFKIIPKRRGFSSLGSKYEVIVRSYERLDKEYLRHNFQQWRNNWDRLTINLRGVPDIDLFEHCTAISNTYNWEKLEVMLKKKLGIKISCVLQESIQKDLFDVLIDSATPIAVWLRKDIVNCDREKELNQLLTQGDLEQLPRYIREKREEANTDDDPEEHFGNHLVLLWEDPNRLTPDVMAPLLSAG